MNRFAVVSKDDEASIKVAKTVQKELLNNGLDYDEKNPEIVCVIGGDGTFLSAIHKYMYCLDKTVFTGIHTGTLGFFVDYTLKEMKECINDISTKQPQIEKKKLLEITLSSSKKYYAVNEMWLESYKTKTLDIYLDNHFLERFHGSGMVISTQTGSTAFSRSIGGSVIQPKLELMEMCEISGVHHAHYRSLRNPLIVSGSSEIKIVSEDFSHTKMCFDRYDIDLPQKQEIVCTLADKYVQLAHYKPVNWVNHLKQLF